MYSKQKEYDRRLSGKIEGASEEEEEEKTQVENKRAIKIMTRIM